MISAFLDAIESTSFGAVISWEEVVGAEEEVGGLLSDFGELSRLGESHFGGSGACSLRELSGSVADLVGSRTSPVSCKASAFEFAPKETLAEVSAVIDES